jgi:hypothetical protein
MHTLLNPALFREGVVFPSGPVFRSHQRRIRNHECLGECVVQPPPKFEVWNVDERPVDVRIDGKRSQRGGETFDGTVDIFGLKMSNINDFNRKVFELLVLQKEKYICQW